MSGFSTQWFMDGMLHPLQTPSHAMVLVGLALLLGQQVNTRFVRGLTLLTISVLMGMVINHYFASSLAGLLNNELILLVLALSIGLLIIMKLGLHDLIIMLTVIICGVMLGLDSSPTIIPGIRSSSIYSWLSGTAVSIVVSISLVSLVSLMLRKLLEGIVLRVMGSWIATSAIFVLTLLLTKH